MNRNEANTHGFDDTIFSGGIHLCYIYNDDEERVKTMSKFFANGLTAGQKALCLVDTVAPHDIKTSLASLGVDISSGERFSIQDNESSYCPQGTFDPDSLLEGVGCFCEQAHEEGYSGARISGDMSWVLRKGVSMEDLMDYEVKVTDYLKSCPFVAICEYDARKFDGAAIMDILTVHPAMIVRGNVVKNPFFIPPDEFIAQYKSRSK